MFTEDAKTQGGRSDEGGEEEIVKSSKNTWLRFFETIHFFTVKYSGHLGCNCEDPMLLSDVDHELWDKLTFLANITHCVTAGSEFDRCGTGSDATIVFVGMQIIEHSVFVN